MPYAHEAKKLKIPREKNRRIALSDEQRAEIVDLWHGGHSKRALARRYAVTKETIRNIVDPQHYAAELEKRRGKRLWAQYYDKEKRAKYTREHRRYKQKLYLNKELIMKKKTTRALQVKKEKPLTPRDRARLVFSSRDSEAAVAALAYYVEKLGYSGDTIRRELPAFILYWTEPTPNGKRQRWQLQKTFDVTRRLITWLRRAESYKSTNKRIGGASITI